jgi:hypothetical protein
MLIDFANVKSDNTDKRWNLTEEFEDIKYFDVVMFTHAHEDHVKGASDFFNMQYSRSKDKGATIGELWLSSAFITDDPSCEDSRVIRQEVRARLKEGKTVKVFGFGNELKKWLESADISESSVEHLIFNAGKSIDHELGDEVSFFLHAPFFDDCDDVGDKNDPSVVMQMRLYNLRRETNIFITGDAPSDVLDEIVQRTLNAGNKNYLQWDIYDIPHHCSDTGLCNNSEEKVKPTNNVEWLLNQSKQNAFIVASCNPLAETETPLSEEAAKAYQSCVKDDVKFKITMEWQKCSSPEPMIFNIDDYGLKLKSSTSSAYYSTSPPRAG